jgi:hypothetical protein
MKRLLALTAVSVLVAVPITSANAAVTATPSKPSPALIWLDPARGSGVVAPGVSSPPLTSPNVTYHGTIPIDSPAVGGEVVNHIDGNRYFYVTGLKGLSIYDISDPEVPLLVSFTPYYHSQNEDLKVSVDGTRAIISADGALLLPISPATVGITVIDTSDPAAPVIQGRNPTSNHTSECADPKCEWIYGSSGGIFDARDPMNIVRVTIPGTSTNRNWNINRFGTSIGSGHALRRDESGLVISDSNPRLILDPRDDPANPVLLAQGFRVTAADNRLQHNNVRTDATQWVARDPSNPADDIQWVVVDPGPRSINASPKRPVMRPGELMIGNAESNLNPQCSNAGGLSTWSIVDFDKGTQMQQLEVFRPLNGTGLDGSPRANGLGCSGHWFTENGGFVAASWYEHGVHFFKIREDIGTIREIGWFQPQITEAGAAYWVDDTHVYNVDYARGIDILSFDTGVAPPSQRQMDQVWLANLNDVGRYAAAERYFCGLSITKR